MLPLGGLISVNSANCKGRMGFTLVRLATLYFSSLSDKWHSWAVSVGPVEIETLGWYKLEANIRLLVAAKIALRYRPKLTASKNVVIPERERKELEAEIESIANLIAVTERTKRSISSPMPPVALMADDEASRDFLEKAEGFLRKPCDQASFRVPDRIDILEKLDLLSDRLDGISLIAESLSHNHATGKFHEYVRVFERAFRLPAKRLIEPLSVFLGTSNLGYTKAEITNWLREIRDSATHADEKRNFVTESDVRPIVSRMEQAVYDVVFNKEGWRTPSTTRRNLLAWPAGTQSSSGGIFSTQGLEGSLEIHLLDEFCAFPLDLSAGLNKMPEGWYSKPFLTESNA